MQNWLEYANLGEIIRKLIKTPSKWKKKVFKVKQGTLQLTIKGTKSFWIFNYSYLKWSEKMRLLCIYTNNLFILFSETLGSLVSPEEN